MKINRSVRVVVIDNTKRDPKNPSEPALSGRLISGQSRVVFALAWVINMMLYPVKVVLHDYCYLGLCRLLSPAYKEHLYWMNLQNLHLDGLHSAGPDPDCEYCDGNVQHVANGGFYRPWFEAGWKAPPAPETP